MPILEPQKAIVCPRGKGETQALALDMTNCYKAEGRIQEVAFVTPHKAPELLAVFNETFLELTRYLSQLDYELNVAERAANKVRAIILLDKVPEILKERGLATAKSPLGSEDIRTAILDTDQEYQEALERCDKIRAISKLLQGKLKAIEMAYTSVKKIIGENVYNAKNPNLTHKENDFGEVKEANNAYFWRNNTDG